MNVTYEFREYNEDDQNVELTLNVDEDKLNCYRLFDFCKRFAVAVGYDSEMVERVFGETKYTEMLE